MTKLLTPQEVLQALADGKNVLYRFYDEVATDNEWEHFYMGRNARAKISYRTLLPKQIPLAKAQKFR